jgi:mRNA-degrading endonuclease RelE of RelBE toxin-antitoxin system
MAVVWLHPKAAKQFDNLNEPMKSRVGAALAGLGAGRGSIKPLAGNLAGGNRLRVGGYRILFSVQDDGSIDVYAIEPRGGAYK